MKSLNIEIQVEDTGDAIDFLQHVVGELHRGYSRGAGWEMEELDDTGLVLTEATGEEINERMKNGEEFAEVTVTGDEKGSDSSQNEPGNEEKVLDGEKVENKENGSGNGTQESTDGAEEKKEEKKSWWNK